MISRNGPIITWCKIGRWTLVMIDRIGPSVTLIPFTLQSVFHEINYTHIQNLTQHCHDPCVSPAEVKTECQNGWMDENETNFNVNWSYLYLGWIKAQAETNILTKHFCYFTSTPFFCQRGASRLEVFFKNSDIQTTAHFTL